MDEFHARREAKKLLHSRYAIAILCVIAILLLHAVWNVYRKYERSKDLEARMQADLVTLEARQAVLVRSVQALETTAGKEREIRDRFGVVKEGERMVVLVGNASAADDVRPIPEPGLWARFWEMLGL